MRGGMRIVEGEDGRTKLSMSSCNACEGSLSLELQGGAGACS